MRARHDNLFKYQIQPIVKQLGVAFNAKNLKTLKPVNVY
jgi:hypothetical protein